MKLEALAPLRLRRQAGTIDLVPGQHVELSDPEGERLLGKVPDKVRRVEPITVMIQPGVIIAWQRGDGSALTAPVDSLHTDSDGVRWAFVTFSNGTWGAVNLKFAKLHEPEAAA